MTGLWLALAGMTIILVAGTRLMQLTWQVPLPADARPYLAASVAAAALGVAALVAGPGIVGGVIAALDVVGGLAFPALYAFSGQSRTPPAVTVGGPIIDFTTTDDEDRPFDLAALRGAPVLLKFFRGHWCPYCVAELGRWEALLRPELDARGVHIVTVCADTAAVIRRTRARHGLHAVMLPDPELAITDRYRLRNPKNFALKSGVIVPLPIPTTILVDAEGTVRWIDQATDYMRRSDPARVLDAVRELDADAPDTPRAVVASRQ